MEMKDFATIILRERHAEYVADLRDLFRTRNEYVRWSTDPATGRRLEGPRVHWSRSPQGRQEMARVRELVALIDDVRDSARRAGVALSGTRPLREVLMPRAWTWGESRGAA